MSSMTTNLSHKLENIVNRAIHHGIATSISLFVGFDDKDSLDDITIESHQASPIYDLASITKISGTTIAVARAVIEGKMGLDEQPFPSWPISIRSILTHTSGLPAHKKFYEDLPLSNKDFNRNLELIKKELFKIAPSSNKTRVYSDLGFIALGFLLEERLKKPLPEIFEECQKAISKDLQLFTIKSTTPFFTPEKHFAPTGFCHARGNDVLGQVHDPNCFFMGGHGGHAGQFGTLRDIKILGQFFLSAIKNPSSPLKDKLAQFINLGLGFDKRSHSGTQRSLSPKTFGHFGYTGTSLWIDPSFKAQGLIVALLTNRVHKSTDPEDIFELRLNINQAICK